MTKAEHPMRDVMGVIQPTFLILHQVAHVFIITMRERSKHRHTCVPEVRDFNIQLDSFFHPVKRIHTESTLQVLTFDRWVAEHLEHSFGYSCFFVLI